MSQHYVYVHIEKEHQVPFYIGIGQVRRAYDKSRNDFWKTFVDKYATNYEVKFIADNISEDIAQEIENLFIAKFGKIQTGKGILLNWTDGGYAEGAFVRLSFEDNIFDLNDKMTEYGRSLYLLGLKEFNLNKVNAFLNEIVESKSKELREKTIVEIEKKSKPISSWIVPFCLSESVKKSDKLKLIVTDLDELRNKVNKPIELDKLPNRPFVDFLIHRIMIYFDLIIQDNVKLEKNENLISKADIDWYFYKDYWKGYIKIIQALNKGLELKVKYIGRNKKDRNRRDIHDFEIETN
jgi:hypothetical protein